MTNSDSANRRVYVDEADDGGYTRSLTAENEHKIAILASVSFSPDIHEEAKRRLEPIFSEFRDSAPAGAKLHITDAFASGNEQWALVAKSVRRRYIGVLLELDAKIIYAARRHAIARKLHELMEAPKNFEKRKTSIRVPGAARASDDRVEDDLMIMLALRLDAYAQDHDPRTIDLLFDETDKAMVDRYKAAIERTRNIGSGTTTIKGWDMDKKAPATSSVTFGADSFKEELSSQYIESVSVAGKQDPLVFAADITANYLLHHLKNLEPDARLNAPASVAGWELEPCVWGVSETAIDDVI
jgi:hypothetical protein